MDGTAIKTIARSNPFVLILENGKIVEKKSLEDFKKKFKINKKLCAHCEKTLRLCVKKNK